MSATQVLTARWIFPVDRAPIERGTIAVRDNTIVAVERAGTRTADVDLGNAAVLPGLVNAHTHLDLSGLRGQTPPSADFTGWLKRVIAYRRSQTSEQIQNNIRAGLSELLSYGTTLVGDIAAEGSSWSALSEAPLGSVVYRELIGLSQSRANEQLATGLEWLESRPLLEHCRAGLSPHAPYSVHRSIFPKLETSAYPVAIHVAETQAELDLLSNHRGPFVDFLEKLGIWEPDALSRDYGNIVRAYAAPTLLVHGNYLPLLQPIPANATVVYCPRTHAAFGHATHPFLALLDRGVRVVLATDSPASNPDLDVLSEARRVHEIEPSLPGNALLRMITLSGAEALGREKTTGSLTPGKSADLVVVPLPDRELNDPHDLLFAAPKADGHRRTMWRGNWRN